MKINDTKVQVQGNFAGAGHEEVRMDFAADANGFLLNNLIKQYKDPYVASLREYTSNARDAHRAHNVDRPIEVSLPNTLSPVLTIRDYGKGLSREALKGFGQFGQSDKRDSNEYTGGFGLGSKSGLAVAAQFTVTSVFEGKRNTVILGRNAQGLPTMTFLAEVQAEADEESGTLISIPTTEGWRFEKAIENHFFMGWAEGTILIDGKFPASANNVHNTDFFSVLGGGLGWKLGKNLYKQQYGLGQKAVALVNGVKYDIDLNMVENLDQRVIQSYLSEIVVNLDNGEVEIHPSRESLIYDARTRKFITERVEALIALGRKVYQDDVNQAASIREALQIRAKAISFGFGNAPFTYQGQIIETDNIKESIKDSQVTRTNIGYGGSRYGLQASRDADTIEGMVTYNFHKVFNRKSVLVVGCGPLTASGVRGRSQHPQAASAGLWAKRIGDTEKVAPTDFDLYFTSLSPKKVGGLGKWVLGAFERIISIEDYTQVVADMRREQARITRANAVKKAAVPFVKEEVRVLVVAAAGNGYYTSVKIEDLDPTRKHILLKNNANDFVDQARSAMLTKIGFSESRQLSAVLTYMASAVGGYTFILANKNTKTDDYGKGIPNYSEDLRQAIENATLGTMTNKTEMQKRATLDRAGNEYYWATTFPKKKIADIKNPKVREWIEAMSLTDLTTGDEFLKAIRELARYSAEFKALANKTEITSKIKVSPGKTFKLLNSFSRYSTPNWDAALEYINFFRKLS